MHKLTTKKDACLKQKSVYLYQSCSYCGGMISIFLDLTASRATFAIELQLTNNWGLIIGSTTSLDLEQRLKLVTVFFVPRYRSLIHK